VRLSGDGITGNPVEGKITAVSPDVDASTRNVRVQATVDNAAGRLRPGMYVDVAVELPVVDKVLTIPSTASSTHPLATRSTSSTREGRRRPARTSSSSGSRSSGSASAGATLWRFSGLKEGDTVVTSGVFRLRPGGAVR
jgi:membrane fusion protein, multidrug efflux system